MGGCQSCCDSKAEHEVTISRDEERTEEAAAIKPLAEEIEKSSPALPLAAVKKEESQAAEGKENLAPKQVDDLENNIVKEADEVPTNETNEEQPLQQEQQHWMEKIWSQHADRNTMTQVEKDFFADKVSDKLERRPSSVGISFPAYVEKHSANFKELFELEKAAGWALKKEVDGTKIFTMTMDGEPLVYTKGTTTINTFENGIRHLVSVMLAPEDRPKYDEVCALGDSIESFLPYYRTVYFRLKSPAFVVAPRDVCTLSRIAFEEDGSLIVQTESVDHPAKPMEMSTNAGHIRCTVKGGYIIRPLGNDQFSVTFIVKANPNGWLPDWVKKLIAWKAQLVLVEFKKHYEKMFKK